MSIRWMVPLVTINIFFVIVGYAKPAEIGNPIDLVILDPEASVPDSKEVLNDAARLQRSPQYGFLNYDDYGDYSDNPEGRHLHKHKRKKPHKPYGHGGFGGFGCRRKHGCGGWQGSYYPEYGGHYPPQQGGSFATASAGSFGGGHYGGYGSQANAQSASFNFGPFSFSVAQAGAGQGNFF